METLEKNDLRKYTYEQQCLVWKQVVRLKKQGYSEVEIFKITGLSKRRVGEIWRMYFASGKQPQPKKRGREFGANRKLTPEQENEIKRIIIDKTPNQLKFNCFLWTANAVRELILHKYGTTLGKQTVREYLKSWGMSSQRPSKKSYKQDAKVIESFKNEVYPSIKRLAKEEDAEIYFVDETGINNQAYNPCGYAPKNYPPVVNVCVSRETVNMMSAVTASGIHKFMLYEESTTQQKLIEFMENLIKDKKQSKVFIILDNLKVHHGKLVKSWAEEHKSEITIFYFPPYAPELNPDEYLNNILKQNIHSGITPKNKKEIRQKVINFMMRLTDSLVQRLFLHPKLAYQGIVDI